MKKVVLIDGHNLLFRMYYGIPAPIKNSKGEDIKGLIGFVGSLKKIVDYFSPYSIVVIFDSESSKNNNLSIDDNYKANRLDYSDVPNELNPFSQLDMIKDALNFLNIKNIEIEDYEADDFIASIIFNNPEIEFIIVSTDTDFLQLVDNHTFVFVPRGKKSILYNPDEVINKYHVPPHKFILYKALVGDSSDNITGIKGIGKITAPKILEDNSIDEYINNNPDTRLSQILIANKETINKNIRLIKMQNNLDVSNITFNELTPALINYKTYEIIAKIGKK